MDTDRELSAPGSGDGAVDLTTLTVQGLLGLESMIVGELRRRGLVRTLNKPLGDIGEQVVLRARGGTLAPNSAKSHDVTTPSGERIQVKSMGTRASGSRGKFSPFRSFDFATAVFLVFEAPSFDLVLAREVSATEVQALARYSKHTNGAQPTLSKIRDAGEDVTTEMRTAFTALNSERIGAEQGPSEVNADAAR